jgi:hypothetical protein
MQAASLNTRMRLLSSINAGVSPRLAEPARLSMIRCSHSRMILRERTASFSIPGSN